MIGNRSAVVIAFDGLIAQTLDLRARAVVEGIDAAGLPVPDVDRYEHVAGRTIAEAVRETIVSMAIDADETSVDISTHRAERICMEAMRGPIMLATGATEWIQRASSRVRIVVRSDTARQHVERLLDAGGLSMFVSLIRCADDGFMQPSAPSSFQQSYQASAERMAGMGVTADRIRGLECAPETLCAQVPDIRVRRVMSVTEATVDALHLF